MLDPDLISTHGLSLTVLFAVLMTFFIGGFPAVIMGTIAVHIWVDRVERERANALEAERSERGPGN